MSFLAYTQTGELYSKIFTKLLKINVSAYMLICLWYTRVNAYGIQELMYSLVRSYKLISFIAAAMQRHTLNLATRQCRYIQDCYKIVNHLHKNLRAWERDSTGISVGYEDSTVCRPIYPLLVLFPEPQHCMRVLLREWE